MSAKTDPDCKIVQTGDSVLREKAKLVEAGEFNTPELRKLIAKMSRALGDCDDGVALAAPQIGVAKQIFVVSRKIFLPEFSEENIAPAPEYDLVFINPKIIKTSKKQRFIDEGCLSVRWIYGQVKRSEKATVEAYDETGKKFTRHGTGLLAQIFQHETDHLNGVLFIDKARDLQEIPPEKQVDKSPTA